MSTQGSISISVGEPIKLSDKFGPYISYKVTTSADREGFPKGEVIVTRRYSEFQWLAKELARLFPGVIVPSLPEKQTVGRFSSDFVESRQRALERFLNRCANHSDLGFAGPFKIFLEADESGLQRAMSESKASKPKMSSTAMAWFESSVNTIQNSGKRAEIEKSAADLQVDEISAYVTTLDKQLQNLDKFSEMFIKRHKDLSTAAFDMGQSFLWMSQIESDPFVNAFNQLSTVTDKSSVTDSQRSESLCLNFLEPMEEYLRLMSSIRTALTQRGDKRNAYIDALTDVEVKQNAYNKLLGVPGKEDQANAKQQAVTKAQADADAAKAEFEEVTERLIQEFEAFKFQKAVDFRSIIIKFAEQQVEHHRKMEEIWSSVLPTLHNIQISGASKGSSKIYEPESVTGDYSSFHEGDMVGV